MTFLARVLDTNILETYEPIYLINIVAFNLCVVSTVYKSACYTSVLLPPVFFFMIMYNSLDLSSSSSISQICHLTAKKMNIGEFLHFKLNQLLLTLFGLWPHQSKFSKRRNYFIFVVCTASLVAPLIQGLTEMKISVIFYASISGILWMIGSLFLCTTLYIKGHSLAKLYRKNEEDYRVITKPDELAIMKIFTREARSTTFIFIGCVIVAGTFYLILSCIPLMFDNGNESYSALFSPYSYHWIIHDRVHKLQVLIHISLLMCYCSMTYITALFIYLNSIKHICGVFTIISQRLQKLVKSRNADLSLKNDREIIPELLQIIAMHREAIKNTDIVREIYSKVFYALQILTLMILAILIFALKSALLAFQVCFIVPILQYILYVNYGGQQIIDYSCKVFETTHLMSWDSLSPKARKILFMIILRSYRPIALKCGTFTISMANVTKIMNMSWSLAAVLWSTQRN